ncbi:MAG TPA: phosphopyruvate hydratase [Rhizomicrobium sp.]|nr:phosphopyruvate hydratase [Rhizomicrobium sp.]
MNPAIAALDAIEILDSRGNPTIRVWLRLTNGIETCADVPSGASTGAFEAVELRDEDDGRFGGKGVRRAIENIQRTMRPALLGHDPTMQADIDRLLIELDGTENKANLGANAIVGVSMAIASAGARVLGLPLYRYLGGAEARRLPVPMMNIINGGRHAANRVEFQEFMIVPHGAPNFAEALRYGTETFQCLKSILHSRGLSTAVGDEGGFAPDLENNEQACELIFRAICDAGYEPGAQVAIALDPAASSFHKNGRYAVPTWGARPRTSEELVDLYAEWVARFPIVSIEDGLAENDWDGFHLLTTRLGAQIQIVGDDIYVTNTKFLRKGIAKRTSNAALIKLNQIGTVTETIEAIDLCRDAGWRYVISHRSGETPDAFIADFAVAMGGCQIKAGAPCRGERIAKYNRLLEIEHQLGTVATFSDPFGANNR